MAGALLNERELVRDQCVSKAAALAPVENATPERVTRGIDGGSVLSCENALKSAERSGVERGRLVFALDSGTNCAAERRRLESSIWQRRSKPARMVESANRTTSN